MTRQFLMLPIIIKPIESLKLTLSFPESVMETFTVILTFESADETLWCDH